MSISIQLTPEHAQIQVYRVPGVRKPCFRASTFALLIISILGEPVLRKNGLGIARRSGLGVQNA